MPKTQVVKWGNSLAVRIPKSVAVQARVKEGDDVMIGASEGRIELRRAKKSLILKDLVAQISPENRHPEVDWGKDVGNEIVEW